MTTKPLEVSSVAREELDALLMKTVPKRSYGGLAIGVVCVLASAVGGYVYAQSSYASSRDQSVVSRSTFDSLTKYVLAREQSTNALLSQIQNDVAALHQTNYALVAEEVQPFLHNQQAPQQIDLDAITGDVSNRLNLPVLFDSLQTSTKRLQERTTSIETRLHALRTQIGSLPALLFSTTATDVDGVCIPVRLYAHDARKQEYTNGKNSLLCSQVRP